MTLILGVHLKEQGPLRNLQERAVKEEHPNQLLEASWANIRHPAATRLPTQVALPNGRPNLPSNHGKILRAAGLIVFLRRFNVIGHRDSCRRGCYSIPPQLYVL